MSKIYCLYNPLAGNMTCEKAIQKLDEIYGTNKLEYVNYCSLNGDVESFFNRLESGDKVILCGGDGTINFFANNLDVSKIDTEILYYPTGSGNDFYHDVEADYDSQLIPLNKYLNNLPIVEVRGVKKRFINGIGYGIDGYCCEEGDRRREIKKGKRVNYTTIALKGLIYAFHRVNATINVDGVERKYEDVWMAPSMNGRYYGGGMMCAPNQERLNTNNKVSVIVVHSKSRIRLLMAFMSIFKGEHLKYTSIVTELKGSEVNVKFDRPTALQIDGETVHQVTEYSVFRS